MCREETMEETLDWLAGGRCYIFAEDEVGKDNDAELLPSLWCGEVRKACGAALQLWLDKKNQSNFMFDFTVYIPLTDCHDITSCNFESIPCLNLKSDGLPFKHKIAHLTADEHVHLPGHADAGNFGKPPLENAQSNERAGGLDGVKPHGTILCSDEAKVYPSSCRKKESSTCLARTDRISSWQKCGLTTKFSLCIPAQATMCPAHDQKIFVYFLEHQGYQKPRLPESQDLATCPSLAVALGIFNTPQFEPAQCCQPREEQLGKKEMVRRWGFQRIEGKLGAGYIFSKRHTQFFL